MRWTRMESGHEQIPWPMVIIMMVEMWHKGIIGKYYDALFGTSISHRTSHTPTPFPAPWEPSRESMNACSFTVAGATMRCQTMAIQRSSEWGLLATRRVPMRTISSLPWWQRSYVLPTPCGRHQWCNYYRVNKCFTCFLFRCNARARLLVIIKEELLLPKFSSNIEIILNII